jgi:hypothetical protein
MWKKWTNGIVGVLIFLFGFAMGPVWVAWVVGILGLVALVTSFFALETWQGALSVIASAGVVASAIFGWPAWVVVVLGVVIFALMFGFEE